MQLYSHQLQMNVRSLGPGQRVGLWVSGCNIGCPGCCSPETNDRAAGVLLDIRQLIAAIINYVAAGGIVDGLTISGGEATEQMDGVMAFIHAFKATFPEADVLLYSGRPWRVIERDFSALLICDVIIAEPFVHTLSDPTQRPVLAGSVNQSFHFQSERGRERFTPYLARPPVIQIHQLAGDDTAASAAQPSSIHFTGVPAATLLGACHD